MKLLTTLLLAFVTWLSYATGPLIVNAELVENYSIQELEAAWKKGGIPKIIAPIHNEINVYEITYVSTWIDGTPTMASGLYFVPKVDGPVPLLVYHHGTKLGKERDVRIGGEQAICVSFATDGYAVLMPDYFGLGKSDKTHLYVHRASEATASVDMLRAIVQFNKTHGITTNGQLFLTGYSQGGHACMATQMLLQQKYADEFTVTASAPMSGPYDVSGVQGKMLFQEYSRPGYLPYLLLGYNVAYHFVQQPKDMFKAPYDSIVPELFDGQHSFKEVNKVLPKMPLTMLKDSILQEFEHDPNYAMWTALKDNDVYDWKPNSPTMLCYCQGDEQVDYRNSLVAYDTMTALGAKEVILRPSGKKFNHGQCAMYATIYTKFWFDSFVKGSKTGRKGPVFKRMLVSFSKVAKKRQIRKKARLQAKQEK